MGNLLSRLWGGSSRADSLAGLPASDPDELVMNFKDTMLFNSPDLVRSGARDLGRNLQALHGAQPSVSRQDSFDDGFASQVVGGYFKSLALAAEKNMVEPYIQGLYHVGSALHNMPRAAERFATGLVTVHQEVATHMGDSAAAQVRGVRDHLLGDNVHESSPVKTGLRRHDFDGRAVGPAQVAGTAAAAAPN